MTAEAVHLSCVLPNDVGQVCAAGWGACVLIDKGIALLDGS